jgi:adenylate cyclase
MDQGHESSFHVMPSNTPDRVRHVERGVRSILVVDMVESVRLIEQDEEGVLARWLSLVEHVETHVLAQFSGRLVKSLGDGMLLDFTDARSATAAAFAIQQESRTRNGDLPPERHLLLRMGIAAGPVLVDRHDVYGRGVNLAARLTGLAGPGEIVASAEVRDQLTPELDADVEDLGECYVKHILQPVRAYRIGAPGPRPVVEAKSGGLLPSIAVVPFRARQFETDACLVGEILAEEIIGALSRSSSMDVISRLSTTAFRSRRFSFEDIDQHLHVNYVVSGTYQTSGDRLALNIELAEVKTRRVVWNESFNESLSGILTQEQEPIGQIVAKIAKAVQSRELQRTRSNPLPRVESYSLLMSAITLMHRMSLEDFKDAHELLQAVLERAPRHPVPQSWLANWHVLRVHQGWTDDASKEANLALDCTKRALDADPDSSLALTINGLVHTHMSKNHDVATERYARAVQADPNNARAWLLKGTLHAFQDQGEAAVADTQRAISLSPLDPHRYYFDNLAATAYIAARKYDLALELAQRSLRANRQHTSTLRAMVVAQWQMGHEEEARQTVKELMRLEPSLTIKDYLRRSPSAAYRTGREWADALRRAGVPD